MKDKGDTVESVRERGWTRCKRVIRENGKRSSDPSGGGWIGNGCCEKRGESSG